MDPWQIVTSMISVIALALGLPALIQFLLGKRRADGLADLEEKKVEISEFDIQTKTYQDLLSRAERAVEAAERRTDQVREELQSYRAERLQMLKDIENLKTARTHTQTELRRTKKAIKSLHELVVSIVDRTSIELLPEEQALLEQTLPLAQTERLATEAISIQEQQQPRK